MGIVTYILSTNTIIDTMDTVEAGTIGTTVTADTTTTATTDTGLIIMAATAFITMITTAP